MDYWDKAETLSRDELAAVQLVRLKNTIIRPKSLFFTRKN